MSAAVMDIFQVEARSWEQFEVHWRTSPVMDSYRYLLEWKYEGSDKKDSSYEDMDYIMLSTKSDGVSRDKNQILKYQKSLSEKSFGGRVVVAITSLSLGENSDICGGQRCCCSPCDSDPLTGLVTRDFYRCFDKHELFALPEFSSSHSEGRICFQVITNKIGASPIDASNPRCRVSSRSEVVLLPPPDSQGLNTSSSRKNSLCIQWRPPENITFAEFLYKNTKRIWTSLVQIPYHPPYLKKNHKLPHYKCYDTKDEPLLSNAGDSKNFTAGSLITLQVKVVYAGQKNTKHDYQVQVPYRKFEGAPTEAFPMIFIASLAATFAMLLVFFIVCLLYRRLTPSKSGGNRILPHDSLSGSIGGMSSLRAETPVNSGGPERVELMATLSRISQMPIHNSFMPVDNPLYLDHTSDLPSDQDLKSLPHFPRTALTLVDYLGSGAFGNVYAGEARDIHGSGTGTVTVAVKTLQPNASGSCKKWSRGFGGSLIWGRDQCSLDTSGANLIRLQMEQEPMQQQFLAEALLMAQFHHDHILPLIGVCLDPHPDGPYMLLEYMDKGDLSNYLKAMRSATPALTLSQLLQMAVQVAMGCKYLEDLHFVHRDLAARNCLVSSLPNNGAIVKVGDFGLARDIYRNDYYRMEMDGKVPFKWMSPESLMDRTWTTKADVWSYGVLVWEIMSLGQQPYPARTNHEVLQFLKDGGRLEKPEKCPDDIYKIMNWCWAFNSEDRPSFAQLVIQLEHLFNQAQRNSGVLRQNRHGSPAGSTPDQVTESALAARNSLPADVQHQSDLHQNSPSIEVLEKLQSSVEEEMETKLDEEMDEMSVVEEVIDDAESSIAAAAAATTHKLRLLSSSPTEDGIVYHVFGDAANNPSSQTISDNPIRVKRRYPSGGNNNNNNDLPAFIYSPLPAFAQSSPRSPPTPDAGYNNDNNDSINEAVKFRFDSPCTMTSSLVSSLATTPITPLFNATPPTTPPYVVEGSVFDAAAPAAPASALSVPPSSSSMLNASILSSSTMVPLTPMSPISPSTTTMMFPSAQSRSSSLRANRSCVSPSGVLPFFPVGECPPVSLSLSPPPTPAMGASATATAAAVDVGATPATARSTATVRPICHHSQIATPSSTLQRSQVPRDVKRPRMPLLQCPPPTSLASTQSASQTISGYPNHASSSSAHSLSPAKHSVGFFQGDVMTTSFPSDKTVKMSHPLQRTFSLEERGGRFRRLHSLNKLLDLKSKTSPAIIPESPPQAVRPAKSCLRRGQRTISGGYGIESTMDNEDRKLETTMDNEIRQ